MSIFDDLMREGQVCRGLKDKCAERFQKKIESESDKKGSDYYKDFVSRTNTEMAEEMARITENAKKHMAPKFAKMRANINAHLTKEISTADLNTLNALNMLDSVSPKQLKLYAEHMGNNPLAMQVLSQIAAKNNIRIDTQNLEDLDHAIDALEFNLYGFINTYQGKESVNKSPFLVRMDPYFKPENEYNYSDVHSAQEANRAFWNAVVGVCTPEMFEGEGTTSKGFEAQYYFADLDGLLDYIKKQTEGMDISEKADKVNEILSNCPAGYGAIYRHYLATGHKMPLLEDLKRPSEREPVEDGDTITE